jgi:hypothetical protein
MATVVVLLRAVSFGSLWFAVGVNAPGALVVWLMLLASNRRISWSLETRCDPPGDV